MNHLSQAVVTAAEALQARCVDGYAWHRAIWTAFPGRPDASRGFLFRVDAAGAAFRVLLLSADEPQSLPWLNWQTKAVAPGFLGHTVYRFQVKANPTLRRSSDKRRLGIYAEDRLAAWMQRKAEENGFRIADDALTVGGPVDEIFIRNGTRGKHVSVDFSGALEVTDSDRFQDAFTHGIGSAKSFGYGLLMLQPLH